MPIFRQNLPINLHPQHLEEVSKVPGFIRTTRFNLLYYRTNAQSRALKGLPARDTDLAMKEPPPYLAIHEFETDSVDMKAVMKTTDTEWAKKIMGRCKTVDSGFWSLKGSFGDKKFFQ